MDLPPKETPWSVLLEYPKGTVVKFYCEYYKHRFPRYPVWIDWMINKEKVNDNRKSD